MKMMRSDGSTPVPGRNQTIQRRGLFAAAWAAVIGLVLKYTTEPVEAAANLQFNNGAGWAALYNTAAPDAHH